MGTVVTHLYCIYIGFACSPVLMRAFGTVKRLTGMLQRYYKKLDIAMQAVTKWYLYSTTVESFYSSRVCMPSWSEAQELLR